MVTDDDVGDMRVLAGGRYVVTGSSEGKIVCWDMGYQGIGRDPEPVQIFEYNAEHPVVFVGASPEPVKRINAGRPQIMIACNHSAGNEKIMVLEFDLNATRDPEKELPQMTEIDRFIIPRPSLFYSHPIDNVTQYFGYNSKCLVHNTSTKMWGVVQFENDYMNLEAMRVIDEHLIAVVRQEGQTQTLKLPHPTMYPTLEEANALPSSAPDTSMALLGECQRRGLTRFSSPSLWNAPAFRPAVFGRLPILFDRGPFGPSFHCFRSYTNSQDDTVFTIRSVHPLPASFAPLPPEGENVLVGSWFIKIWFNAEASCLDVKVAKFQSSNSSIPNLTWAETETQHLSWVGAPFLILTDVWRGVIYVREEGALHGELRVLEFVDPV